MTTGPGLAAEAAEVIESQIDVRQEDLLTAAERFRLLAIAGVLLLLLHFGSPTGGLIALPVTFFMMHRLHLEAHELALFNLMIGAPLYVSFLFGLLRDRWSPFGRGDRGHLMLFGGLTGALFAALAFLPPTYFVLLAGMLLITAAYQTAGSAATGLTSAIGQQRAMAGQVSTILNLAAVVPGLVAFALGGYLSSLLGGADAVTAARTLFLVGAAIMAAVALFGAAGPKALFDIAAPQKPTTSLVSDLLRLARHAPIYPVLIIQALWQFAPAAGTVLQYHMTRTLHASDTEWGLWNAFFAAAFAPTFLLYGWLCQKVKLSVLLWVGTIVAVFQMVPLLFVHSAGGALLAAIPMGIVGGVAQAAFTDLAIRSCPRGLQGTMMMLFTTVYWVAVRFGDVLGTNIYDHMGGFIVAVGATIFVYALMVPALLLVPRGLIDSKDGDATA